MTGLVQSSVTCTTARASPPTVSITAPCGRWCVARSPFPTPTIRPGPLTTDSEMLAAPPYGQTDGKERLCLRRNCSGSTREDSALLLTT
eukprot:SAG22_NODE_18786_length_281_cov_1.120879_1_plen_88_part_01